ncbi:unnamed protein product [Cuscuta campestris]|uniref:Uncharacterized protein n=1 Tax=Cuscuta campestris TaxID=132261 RepID=A0A484LX56_9ASTE|nr:unnamed protein product [Cuscuta campestris]
MILKSNTLEILRFSRGSVQTILPPMKNGRSGRLCGSFVSDIESLEKDASYFQDLDEKSKSVKRKLEEELRSLNENMQSIKRRRIDAERDWQSKDFRLQDAKKSNFAVTSTTITSSDELLQEESKIVDEIQEERKLLEQIQLRVNEAETKRNHFKMLLKNICESAKVDIDALENAEGELMKIDKYLDDAKMVKLIPTCIPLFFLKFSFHLIFSIGIPMLIAIHILLFRSTTIMKTSCK